MSSVGETLLQIQGENPNTSAARVLVMKCSVAREVG